MPRPKPAAAGPKQAPSPPVATLSTGSKVPLDGDLVYLIDRFYRDFAVRLGFAPQYAEIQKEIARILDQMDPATTREYFAQSLFLNYTTYENEMAERLGEQIKAKAKRSARR